MFRGRVGIGIGVGVVDVVCWNWSSEDWMGWDGRLRVSYLDFYGLG